MTSGKIPLAGVVGSPIGHSLSPSLHAYWLRKYSIRGHYIPLDLAPDKFEPGLRALAMLGFRGVNVTLPYKETALTLADIITDRAALIGAANTLTFRRDGRIQADNTDGYGFIENIRQNKPNWRPKAGPAMVLGAGGASRAVISALLGEGVPEIRLANRTKSRAEMLCDHFGARVRVADWPVSTSDLDEIAFLVNTTSLGMTGKPGLKIDLSRLSRGAVVTDIVYSPLRTELLKSAEVRGCAAIDGLGMLLHQAVPGFESWFRKKPTVGQGLRDAVLGA
ncbi:MAG: shikimate dehydrogenase [Paracoccaceae bacterium]